MLNNLEWKQWDLESFIESAELYMEDNKYNEAIQCLNAALDLDACHVAALELRARAWKALGSAEQFTEDIEKAIQLAPHRVQLYLMMKEHLLSRGKMYQAIQLLRAATFRVYFDDPELGQLKKEYQQLKGIELNHLIELPAEIIRFIFSFLPFTTLITCLTVSRKWRALLISIPALWHHVDFGTSSAPKQSSVIESLKNYSTWSILYQLKVSLCDRTLGILMRDNQCKIRELDLTSCSVRVDDLLLVMAMRQLGSTWQRVSISSAIHTPRVFFTAAALFCPQLTVLNIKEFYHPLPNGNDQQVEYDIMSDLGISVSDTAPLNIETLTFERSVLSPSTLQALFTRCRAVQKLVFMQCKSMLNSGTFFHTMVQHLPPATIINSINIEQRNAHDLEESIFGVDPQDLCAMLRTRPPQLLNINHCDMYREAIEAIVASMHSGILMRYNRTFHMDQSQQRSVLATCLRVDRSWQMIIDEIERDAIQTWMDSQGWSEDEFIHYDFYDPWDEMLHYGYYDAEDMNEEW